MPRLSSLRPHVSYNRYLGLPLTPAFADRTHGIWTPFTWLLRNDVEGVGTVRTVAIDDVAGVRHGLYSLSRFPNAIRLPCVGFGNSTGFNHDVSARCRGSLIAASVWRHGSGASEFASRKARERRRVALARIHDDEGVYSGAVDDRAVFPVQRDKAFRADLLILLEL